MRGRLLAAIALGAFVVVGAAGAAGQWIEPEAVSPAAPNVGGAQIGLDADGNAIAVWETSGLTGGVKAAFRPVGGSWGEPDDLSPLGGGAGDSALWMHSGGSAVALWSNGDEIHANVRPAGGDWQSSDQLSTEGRGVDNQSVVAGDAAGNVVALWIEENEAADDFLVRAADRPAGGDWESGEDLSTSGAGNVRVAVNAAGDAVAVWLLQVDTPQEGDIVQARVRPAGEAWGPVEDLTTMPDPPAQSCMSGSLDAAIDPAGKAVVVWAASEDCATFATQAVFYPPGGPWGTPGPVSPPGEQTDISRVAMDSDGNTTVIWRTNSVRATTLPAGESTWEAAETLSPLGEGTAQQLQIAYDAVGNAFALWPGTTAATGDFDMFIQGSTRAPDGDWTAAEAQISTASAGSPDIAFDALGNAAVAWTRFDGTNRMIEWAVYDVADPELRGIQVPSTGFARQRLTFSVEPFEIAPDGPPEWDFGDGTQAASGSTVRHTFAGPGTYNVEVSQLDKAGNETFVTRNVSISVVKCFGSRATKVGSNGSDVLRGTGGRDVLVALGGADTIRGRGGNDKICGGGGPDRLFGQGGNDSLNGQAGNDVCRQGSGIGRHVSC